MYFIADFFLGSVPRSISLSLCQIFFGSYSICFPIYQINSLSIDCDWANCGSLKVRFAIAVLDVICISSPLSYLYANSWYPMQSNQTYEDLRNVYNSFLTNMALCTIKSLLLEQGVSFYINQIANFNIMYWK